ncbi:hypothetical protein BDV12DRAFT_173228 [Aspergillus spectabilis]
MTRPRRNWTAEEDMILREEVEKAQAASSTVSWNEIATSLPGRTNKDKRWHGTTSGKVNKGPWTEDEDERLRKAVQQHGPKWTVVASFVRSRLPDQCSKRWSHAIKPEIDHSPWDNDEDKLLIESVQKYGHSWQQIVSLYFPRRTSLSAKNRYHLLQRRSQHNSRRTRTPRSIISDITTSDYESGDANDFSAWLQPSSTAGFGDLGESLPPGMEVDEENEQLPDTVLDLPSKNTNDLWRTTFSDAEPSGDMMELVGFPFPYTDGELSDPLGLALGQQRLSKNESQISTADGLTPYLSRPLSSTALSNTTPNSVKTPQTQRRVTIHAVCSSDRLAAIFQAVTDLSISAVFKTDEQGSV